MILQRPPLQKDLFDVSGWRRDQDFGVFPVGSRPKELLIAPDDISSSLIRPGHNYLFKSSSHNYPAQYWAEVIAYRISLVTGVTVPPAFAAFDSRTGQRGALIEWFYDRRQEFGGVRFIHGVDYLKRIIPNFDFKTGRQHNLRSVLALLSLIRKHRQLTSPILYWGQIFAFDSLIGNTDRHQENWGLLWSNDRGLPRARFAPAFDNGTSLGHEQTEGALARFGDSGYLERYVARGRHHMRWGLGDDRISHFDMLKRLVLTYPIARRAVRMVARSPMSLIADEIQDIGRLGQSTDLSTQRSSFVLALTDYRHHLLQEFV